jgi:hypothetical protein
VGLTVDHLAMALALLAPEARLLPSDPGQATGKGSVRDVVRLGDGDTDAAVRRIDREVDVFDVLADDGHWDPGDDRAQVRSHFGS